jgi:hypothetical protein
LRDQGWVGATIGRAHAILESLRRTDPDAAGLIVAVNEKHARWIATIMAREIGVSPVVVVHHDPAAGERITQFRGGRAPWLVAVRMVSEGVDLPRARVLCYLSTILTETFFTQMVGRVVRTRDGVAAPAYVIFPDDPVLRTYGQTIENDVHSVRRIDPMLLQRHGADVEFDGLSHDATAERAPDRLTVVDVAHDERGQIIGEVAAAVMRDFPLRNTYAIVRVPAGLPASLRPGTPSSSSDGVPAPMLLGVERKRLRREVSELTKRVAARFRVEVKNVHHLLGRRDGVTLDLATVDQLRRRKRTIEIWLRQDFLPK